MKKLITVLAFLLAWGCAGKKYGVTEGPFRAKFARPFSMQYVNKPWSGSIFFDGVLPTSPIHVEGWLDNNGGEYYQFHADVPEIRSRFQKVTNTFTPTQYCEAIGRPLDRFDAGTQFWNRGNQQDPFDRFAPVPEFAADGTVTVRFEFYGFQKDEHGEYFKGKLLTRAKTVVKLECPQCRCGGMLR